MIDPQAIAAAEKAGKAFYNDHPAANGAIVCKVACIRYGELIEQQAFVNAWQELHRVDSVYAQTLASIAQAIAD